MTSTGSTLTDRKRRVASASSLAATGCRFIWATNSTASGWSTCRRYVAQGLDLHGFPPHAQLLVDDGGAGEPLCRVKYLPQGARFYFECDVHAQAEGHPHYGESFGREAE